MYYLQHTYHSRLIPEGVEEASQIFSRDAHVLPKLVSYEEHCRRQRWKNIISLKMLGMRNTTEVTGGKPIAV
jgi:hypothetical protein